MKSTTKSRRSSRKASSKKASPSRKASSKRASSSRKASSKKASTSRKPRQVRLSPVTPIPVQKVCSSRKTKAYPNRYLKTDLIREAFDSNPDMTVAERRMILSMPVKDLCNFLSSNPRVTDNQRYAYVEVSSGISRPRPVVRGTAGILGRNRMPDSRCITSSRKPLKDHQKNVVKALQKYRGVIAVHQVGTGKTLTAVTASQCFLDQNPDSKVIVLTPTSLQGNFKKEVLAYGGNPNDPRYEFYTLQGFMLATKRGETNCTNKMLIVDEAHNLRAIPGFVMGKPTGIMADSVIQCSKKAKKVLLLTATPVVNGPSDMISLLAMINGTDPMKEKDFDKMLADNPRSVIDMFKCKVSFYERGEEVKEKYPERKDKNVFLKMSPEYYEKYTRVQTQELDPYLQQIFKNIYNSTSDLTRFYNGVRRASNNLEQENSPKVNWIMKKINKTGKKHKFVVFSHFIEAGSKLLIRRLLADDVPFAYIDGTMNMRAREEAVRLYNENKIKVLIISKAGGEGLDLKGTREIVLMEPSWNETTVDQVIGRGIRYESHEHLSPSKRKVKVSRLFMIKPEEYENKRQLLKMPFEDVKVWSETRDEPLSVDLYLYKLSKKKQEANSSFIDMLKNVSIETRGC